MQYLFLIVSAVFFLSCGSNESKKPKESGMSLSQPLLAPFFDSIGKRYALSTGQVSMYTGIDSIYYSGDYRSASFSGDSLFQLPTGYKAGIVNYNDGKVCRYKFLLIFKPEGIVNTDLQIIYSECDRYPNVSYSRDEYVFTTDSTFKTIESSWPANSPENAAPAKKVSYWKINQEGLIEFMESTKTN